MNQILNIIKVHVYLLYIFRFLDVQVKSAGCCFILTEIQNQIYIFYIYILFYFVFPEYIL